MARYYLDSSALAKNYIQETGSPHIRQLLDNTGSSALYTSIITKVEVTSAFARRMRDGSLSVEYTDNTLRNFDDDFNHVLSVIEIETAIIDRASSLAMSHGLRAYDAVQLSTALRVFDYLTSFTGDFYFISADKDLLLAAKAEGLSVKNPNEPFTI